MSSIVPSLISYGQWLAANPGAAARASDIAVTGCPVEQQLTERMASMASMAAHEVPSPTTVVVRSSATSALTGGSTSPVPGPGATPGAAVVTGPVATAVVTVVLTRTTETTVSSSGAQLSASPALDNVAADVTLQLGSDKRWRMCQVQPLQAVGAGTDGDDLDVF